MKTDKILREKRRQIGYDERAPVTSLFISFSCSRFKNHLLVKMIT